MKIKANGIDIEVEDTGGTGPVVVLIMGLGMQLVAWPLQLVDALVAAGYRVIRHDNRDIGLSQKFDDKGVPNLLWESIKLKLGVTLRPPYSLNDMALDTVGVIDTLGIAQAHIVGASMGGMIAQRVALAAPQRVLSLTSIMSTSGAKGLPTPKPAIIRALMASPKGREREAIMKHYVELLRVIGSPAYPMEESQVRERIMAGLTRSYAPMGTLRQMVSIAADTGRAKELSGVFTPTLVIHGRADPLVPFACGQDTAKRIPGARLFAIDGMGHDLPPEVIDLMLPSMLEHLHTSNGTLA